jgi:Predicted transcriptional regulators
MNVKIGENIRRLRTERAVTQERLAEYLGVSAQAVSRWESETCYPDLEALPGIASYFGVTIDKLLGYDASEQEQIKIIMYINELFNHGKIDEACVEARKALAQYPKNYSIVIILAASLLDNKKDSPELDECIALCRRLLRDCVGSDTLGDILRLTAKNFLVVSLCKSGDRAGALEIAQTMPAFNMTRELNIQMALTGDEKRKNSLLSLPLICTMLGSLFLNNMACADAEKPHAIWEYLLCDCIRDISLWDVMYTEADKLDGGTAKRKCFIYMFLNFIAARRNSEIGDNTSAVEYLKKAAACLSFNEVNSSTESNLGARMIAAREDPACAKRDDNYKDKSNAFFIYHGYIENGCFASLENEPGYAEIAAEINALAEI